MIRARIRASRTLLISSLALASLPVLTQAQAAHDHDPGGAVFVMTNAADKNEIISYARKSDGSLTDRHIFATGGRGSGGATDPLGSQGSLTLSQDHSFLLAVNAGSGEISVFRVFGSSLFLVSKVPCGGSEPVAVAEHNHLVYVVNAGGASNVTGFLLNNAGQLKPIPNSTAFLTTTNSGASSLSFSPDGQFLLVAEKLNNNIDLFPVQNNGTLGTLVANASAGPGLFGVLFAPNGTALTTQTGPAGSSGESAISSYAVESSGSLSTTSANVPTDASATCWHVVTPNGKFVYTSNPGSGTISGFSLASNGTLTPIGSTVVATLPAGSANLDIAVSADGKFLYTVDSGTGTVSVLSINSDGTVTIDNDVPGLTANAGYNGIAAE